MSTPPGTTTASESSGAPSSALQRTSLSLPALPTRTGNYRDERVKKITLKSNTLKIGFTKGAKFYVFSVKIHEKGKPVAQNIRRMGIPLKIQFKLIDFHSRRLKGTVETNEFVFNGTTIISNFRDLAPGNEELVLESRIKSTTYEIHIQFVRDVDLGTSQGQNDVTSIVGSVGRQVLIKKLKYTLIKRTIFSNEVLKTFETRGRFAKKFTVYGGYNIAAESLVQGLSIVIDPKQKLMREETMLYLLKQDPRLRKNIAKVQVYAPYNNAYYTLSGINEKMTPLDYFERDGKKMTYQQYYKEMYNIDVKKDQPLLECQMKRKGQPHTIHLIPELVIMATVDARDQAASKRFLGMAPEKRMGLVKKVIDQIYANKSEFEKIHMVVENSMQDAPATVLSSQKILFGNGKSVDAGDRGQWTARDVTFVSPVQIKKWAIIGVDQNEQECESVSRGISQVARRFGVPIGAPAIRIVKSDYEFSRTLKEIREKAPDTEVCAVVLPSDNKATYADVKTEAYRLGMKTQCAKAENISRGKLFDNLFVQMQSKLNGSLWNIDFEIKASFMVIGMDVSHLPKQTKCVGGLCASMNNSCSRYYHESFDQDGELFDPNNVTNFMATAVKRYADQNGGKEPVAIVVYRDAVGVGDVQKVLDEEIVALKKGLTKYKAGYNPTICVMLVNKRIAQKFFTVDGRNPPIGTLITDKATHKDCWEFYLITTQPPQAASVCPIRCHVIHNATKLTPEAIEVLTFRLCHIYPNWFGTIRLPAPLMLADRLVNFMVANVKAKQNQAMSDYLHFL